MNSSQKILHCGLFFGDHSHEVSLTNCLRHKTHIAHASPVRGGVFSDKHFSTRSHKIRKNAWYIELH